MSGVQALLEAVRAGDVPRASAMLATRPELVYLDAAGNDERQALHHAVLVRSTEMVRLLMRHGADAHRGVYPHRDLTTPLALARSRGYEEIAAVIKEEESGRPAREKTRRPELVPAGPLTKAVRDGDAAMLRWLLDAGLEPDEPTRVEGLEEIVISRGAPLWHCAGSGRYEMAEMLLRRGAEPNAGVYAGGTPVFQAYGQRDWKMIELLARYGGVADAATAGLYRQTELAKRLLVDNAAVAEELLWGAACGGDPEIVRTALDHIDWPRDEPKWFRILEQPLRIWNHGSGHWSDHSLDRSTYISCFSLVLERCDPNVRGRFGLTMMHEVAGSREHVTPEERVAFATLLLDAGARLDVRDELLDGTPLEWARRKGRDELVRLFTQDGAA